MATFQPPATYSAGIIGLGGMGRIMLAEMNAHPRFEVAAAWDPEEAAGAAARENNSWLDLAESAAALIARDEVHLVYVASPPRSHAEYVEAACDAGKHVFCEKPLGVHLESSRALLARADGAGVACAVNFTHAASLDAERARLALKTGDLGKVAYVSMSLHLPEWPRAFQRDAAWLRLRAEGGFTREVLSHWVYLSLRLFGGGEVKTAHAHFPDGGSLAEDRVMAELDFNGTPALVSAAVGGRGPVGMEYTVWGTKRSLRLSSGGGMLVHESDGWRASLRTSDAETSDRSRGLDNLAALLDGRPNTTATLAEAYAVQTIIEGILAGRGG